MKMLRGKYNEVNQEIIILIKSCYRLLVEQLLVRCLLGHLLVSVGWLRHYLNLNLYSEEVAPSQRPPY